jgi:hypothetical protein
MTIPGDITLPTMRVLSSTMTYREIGGRMARRSRSSCTAIRPHPTFGATSCRWWR